MTVLEAVLLVDAVPDPPGRRTLVPGVALWVQQQVHIGCIWRALIWGDTQPYYLDTIHLESPHLGGGHSLTIQLPCEYTQRLKWCSANDLGHMGLVRSYSCERCNIVIRST